MYTFDLKGSTVDRRIIKRSDLDLIHKNEKFFEKYKKSTLKDNDFSDLKLSLLLKKEDANKIVSRIEQDSKFLQSYNLTDYSLLLSIHVFMKEDYDKAKDNPRIFRSVDGKYLYCFSIIDFLSVISFLFFFFIQIYFYKLIKGIRLEEESRSYF